MLWIIYVSFWALGGLFLLIALISFMGTNSFKSRAVETEATVTSFYGYYPIVVFDSQDGQKHQSIVPISQRPSPYMIGSRIRILYDPNRPTRIMLNTPLGNWIVPGVLIFIGVVFIFVGFMVKMALKM